MTEPTSPTSTDGHDRKHPSPASAVATWLSVGALLICALLVLPYRALASPVLIPIFALAIAAGIAGIVFGIRARRIATARATWAMICALAALLTAAILAVVFVVGMISATSMNKVELRGQGPEGMSASFSNDMEQRTEIWPSEGWAKFNTKGTWAELTIEAPEDADSKAVRCQIIWNGQVVVEEASERSVTCRYDAD